MLFLTINVKGTIRGAIERYVEHLNITRKLDSPLILSREPIELWNLNIIRKQNRSKCIANEYNKNINSIKHGHGALS